MADALHAEPGMGEIDFASDVTAKGRRLRVFSVVDAFTRECLAPETDTSVPSLRVTTVLQSIINQRGAPEIHSFR